MDEDESSEETNEETTNEETTNEDEFPQGDDGLVIDDYAKRLAALDFASRINNFESTTDVIVDRANKFLDFLNGSRLENE